MKHIILKNYKKKKYAYPATLAVVSLSLLTMVGIKYAHAQQAITFTISPPVINATLNPGDKSEGVMKIINDTNQTQNYTVSVQDFIVDNSQGIPHILPPDTLPQKYSAASWIGVDNPSLSVPAHTRVTFNYFIQTPANARPGGHYAAALIGPDTSSTLSNSGTGVSGKIGTLFYIDINGNIVEHADVAAFQANGFQEYGPVTINTLIRNQGDLHITPLGTITLKDMLGRVVATEKLDQHNIFPGGIARAYQNVFGQNQFMIGPYTAKLAATYGRNNNLPLVATLTFWVFPWKVVTLVILILIALILAVKVLRSRKGKPPVEHHEEEDKKVTETPVETPKA